MIQLAESILPEDTSLGVAYLLALDEVCLTDICMQSGIKTRQYRFAVFFKLPQVVTPLKHALN